MRRLHSIARRAFRWLRGQAIVEYALLLALIALVVLAGLTALKEEEANTMGTISNSIGNVMGSPGNPPPGDD